MKQKHIFVSEQLHQAVKLEAVKENKSMQQLINDLMKNNKRKSR